MSQVRRADADHRVRARSAGDRADPHAHRRTDHRADRSAGEITAAVRDGFRPGGRL